MSSRATKGWVSVGTLKFRCAIGQFGKNVRKQEGDGTTPIGIWHPTRLYYRADRITRPISALPTRPIGRLDGWCDDPDHRDYNRLIRHPISASAEHLWREDHCYDLVITLNHNTAPIIKRAGSAIFIHVERKGFQPTQGCIALDLNSLRILAQLIDQTTSIQIPP